MIRGRVPLPRAVPSRPPAIVLAFVLATVSPAGCARPDDVPATAAAAPVTPEAPAELAALLVTDVPSGLPRLPDAELDPPAGRKLLDDVARYAPDPEREREVLRSYGYRYGWERFWGSGRAPVTSVFLDQFEDGIGAAAYAADLARNDAELYGGTVTERSPHLPAGCRGMTVPQAVPEAALPGPSAFAWCAHGVFSVSVTAVAGTEDAATAEVAAVLRAQLEALPPG